MSPHAKFRANIRNNKRTQTAAELLVFVQKSKMAAAAIMNYYFVTPDHPRNRFTVLNLPFKFCVDRVYTFRDIGI